MKFTQMLRRTAIGVTLAGAASAALAYARSPRGVELRSQAAQKITEVYEAIKARLTNTEPEAPVEPVSKAEAQVMREHELEHGPVGREWAAAHAQRPNLSASRVNAGGRNPMVPHTARHI